MGRYAKAIVAAGFAAGTALIPALDGGLTVGEIIAVVLAGLIGGGLVAAVPNAATSDPPTGRYSRP